MCLIFTTTSATNSDSRIGTRRVTISSIVGKPHSCRKWWQLASKRQRNASTHCKCVAWIVLLRECFFRTYLAVMRRKDIHKHPQLKRSNQSFMYVCVYQIQFP
jgi:hypothetical protein